MAGNMRAGIRLEVDRTGNIRAFDMLRGDVRELNAEARRTNEQLRNMNRTAAQGAASFDQFRSAIGQTVMYAGIAAGVGAIAAAMSKVVEVGNTMQGLESNFTASFGSLKAAQSEIGYIKDLAGDLGLQFVTLGKDYGQWSAAVAGTALAGAQQKTIFESMSKAAKVLNLSADDTSGALRAMAQMVSKGKVQAEELRGQLGERLPGAFQMAARAMGVTTAQLNKMLELGQVTAEQLLPKLAVEMEKTFGGTALEQAKNNFASNTNRMYNALNELANNIFKDVSPALSTLASGVTAAAKHQDALYASASALAAFLAARGVSAFAAYAASQAASVTAARAGMAANAQRLQSEANALRQANAAAASTAAARAREAQATVVSATASTTRTAALLEEALVQRSLANEVMLYGPQRAAIEREVAAARAQHTLAVNAQRTATTQLTAVQAANMEMMAANNAALRLSAANAAAASGATGLMATAGRGLASVLTLVGGPVGALVIGIAGLAYWLKSLADEEKASADAIQNSAGEWVKYTDITTEAAKLSQEYTAAAPSRREAIEKETKALQANTQAAYDNAKAKLADLEAALAKAKQDVITSASAPMYDANGEYLYSETDGYATDATGAAQNMVAGATTAIEKQKAALEELKKQLDGTADVQAHLGEATAATTPVIAQNTAAVADASKANIEAGKAIHTHGDALKSLIDGLAKSRIELEHGKLAAQYYTDRLNGLTDAEARAAAGANQYNTLLAERQKLNREAAEMSGGLRTKYLNGLDDQGLSSGAMAGIDAAQAATDQAVAAAGKYQAAIDATTESLKQQAEAAKAAATGAVSSFAAQAASIQNISGAALTSATNVVAKLQQLGWTKNQAIGIAANIKQESEFNPGAIGDGGKAYGLAQWHPDRQASFKQTMGRDIRGSSAEAQVEFISKELFMANGGGAGKRIKSTDSAAEAAAIMSKYYERPAAEAAEMTRRAGIANSIAKSLGDSVPTFRAVATEAAKVAPAVAQAAPVLDAIAAKTQTMADVTVEYGGAIDSARASQKDILDLADQYMSNQANALILAAADHAKQVALTGAEYRQWQLTQKEFTAGEQEKILLAEQLAAYADESVKLEEERGNIRASLADQYQQSLEKQNLTQQQIAELVAKKMAIGAEKLVYEAEQQTTELHYTAEAWRAIELSQQGYNTAQVASITGAEKLLERTKAIRAATDKIGEGMFAALTSMGDAGVIDGLKSTLENAFKDMVLTPTVKPITDAISVGMSNTISGQANPWAGLQQQYAQTTASMQAGGWQGAATAAGVGATVSSLFGGSQANATGAAIGGAIGNAILPGIGGAIVSALGHLAGGLFEDNDSARAKFTNGNPADGFVYRDGNKLSASSVYGSFGFQEDGTHDLGNSAEKEMAAFVARMAEIDNALASFIPATETARIKAELAGFEHTGLDFADLFKQRLVVITSGLSETMRGLIDYSKDADGILARINDLIAIQKEAVPALRNMNMQIGATDDAALSAAAGLADAAGGLQNLTSIASAYYAAVYSEDEQKQNSIRTAQAAVDAFNAANNAQINSLSGLRRYVEGLDVTNPAAQQASLAAMALADELQLLAGSAAGAAANVSDLDSANAKLAEQQTIFSMFSGSLRTITDGLDKQLNALEASYKDQIAAYEKARDIALSLRDAQYKLKSGDLTTLVPVQQLAAAREEFERLYKAAKTGDVVAAGKLETAGDVLLRLSREYNASSDDYSADFSRVSNGWESVAKLLEAQRDPQDELLEAQNRLIDQAASQAAQLAALYGGILGGNALLAMMGDDINNLPPDLAKAIKAVLDGIKPDTPTTTTLTVAEYKAKAYAETSKLTDPTAQIASLYPLLLDRAGDLAGINYWAAELKNGVALKDVIARMVDAAIANGEWAKIHPNSHAAGLYSVPYDNYAANLHAGEAVVDAASMSAMRKYGIPLQRTAQGNNIVVNVDMAALVQKVEALTSKVEAQTAEIKALRSERNIDAREAQATRSAQLHQTGEGTRAVTRAVRMRGAK